MAQLTIYLDKETAKKVLAAAGKQQISTSRWVKQRIESYFLSDYPPHFIGALGSLAEVDFPTPPEPPRGGDIPREKL